MQTSRSLLRAGPSAVQPFRSRATYLTGRPRPAYLSVCSRAAVTMTPAPVVTTANNKQSSEDVKAVLGPLGQGLIQKVEVRNLEL